MNKVEQWKQQKHGLDVWPDMLRYASERRPMANIDDAELERMKWYGAFYRRRDGAGTYMLRLRVTAGELTAAQAKTVAYVAYEFGYGIIDVTTRSNLQVQGLAIADVPAALARLEAVGLSARQTGHDNVRNVFGHPLAGIDPEELLDTRELCRDITALVLDNRDYADLPRKFNIALSGRDQHASYYWTQDVSFLAHRAADGETAFQVLIGGTQGQNPRVGWHLPLSVRPDQIVPVVQTLLELFRQQGGREKRDAARFRFLIERIGVPGVLDWLERRIEFPLQPCVSPPPPPVAYDELTGWRAQKQANRWAMGLCVPLGRLSWQQMEAVGVLAKRWGDGTLRTTPEQGLIVPNIPTGFKDAAATSAAACGLSVHADTLLLNTVACTGKQFCNIAVTETKGHMLQLIESLRKKSLALHGIRIHMSGCPSSCAGHFTADIGLKGVRVRRLLGTREGFDVYLGGGLAGEVTLGTIYRLGVDVHQLPQMVEEVVRQFYLHHKSGQTFSSYWREELRDREAAKTGDRDYVKPIWLCEACQYRHEAEDPPAFCPKCAGLRRNFARLNADDEASSTVNCEHPGADALISSASDVAAPLQIDDGYLPLARLADVPQSEGLAIDVAGREIALFRKEDGHGVEILAIDNACPHQGGPLAQGQCENGVVTCPWHNWSFDARTGACLQGSGPGVRTYPVRLQDGVVCVQIEDSSDSTPATLAAMTAAASVAPLGVQSESGKGFGGG